MKELDQDELQFKQSAIKGESDYPLIVVGEMIEDYLLNDDYDEDLSGNFNLNFNYAGLEISTQGTFSLACESGGDNVSEQRWSELSISDLCVEYVNIFDNGFLIYYSEDCSIINK